MSLNSNALNSVGRIQDIHSGQYLAFGNDPKIQLYRKFGRIDAIQQAVPADVWEFGKTVGAEKYTFSTTDAINNISSSNTGDAMTILIGGLALDGTEVNQAVALNGQSKVPIPIPLWRVNRAYNNSGVNLLGDVYIYEDTPLSGGIPVDVTKVRGYIAKEAQQTLQGIYTVPKGKNALLMQLKTSLGGRKNGFASFESFFRTLGGVFLVKDTHELATSGTSAIESSFTDGSIFPELTDFIPRVTVDTDGLGFSISFRLRLVDNV